MKKRMEKRRDYTARALLPASRGAICFLRVTLPLILAECLVLLGFYLRDRKADLTGANLYYPMLLEIIFAAMLLVAFGVLVLEALERDAHRE